LHTRHTEVDVTCHCHGLIGEWGQVRRFLFLEARTAGEEKNQKHQYEYSSKKNITISSGIFHFDPHIKSLSEVRNNE
jgi:hypothetical protein